MTKHQKVILIVSVDCKAINRLKEILTNEGWGHNVASHPDEVAAILECNSIDLVMIDLQGPRELWLALLREITNRYLRLPIITIAGICDIDAAASSLQYGAYDYVTKPLFSEEVTRSIKSALERRMLEVKLMQLESSFDQKLGEKCEEICVAVKRTLAALALTLEASDSYTAGHSRRVSAIATAIGKNMGLDGQQLDNLRWGGLLHDIGKIAIDRQIINKPAKLTQEEYAHVMTHPLVGVTIVSQVINNANISEIIEHHHCYYNGHGHGQTIKGENIPLLARILAVADAYDAMTSLRPYRPTLSREEAIAEIIGHIGSQFDPVAARTFSTLSIKEMAEEKNKLLVGRDGQSERLLLKTVLFNKYARAEWLKDLCP